MPSSIPNRRTLTQSVRKYSTGCSIAALALAVAAVSGCTRQAYDKTMVLAPEPQTDKATEMRNYDQSSVIYPSGSANAGNTLFDYTAVNDRNNAVEQALLAVPAFLGNVVTMPVAAFNNRSDQASYSGYTVPQSYTVVPPLGDSSDAAKPVIPVEQVTIQPVAVPATGPATRVSPVDELPPVKDVPTTITPTTVPAVKPAPVRPAGPNKDVDLNKDSVVPTSPKPAPVAQPSGPNKDTDLNKDTIVPTAPATPAPKPVPAPAPVTRPVAPAPTPLPAPVNPAPSTRPAAPATRPAVPTTPTTRPVTAPPAATVRQVPAPVPAPAPTPTTKPVPPTTRPVPLPAPAGVPATRPALPTTRPVTPPPVVVPPTTRPVTPPPPVVDEPPVPVPTELPPRPATPEINK